MRSPQTVTAGGFYLEHGLLDEYYAFSDGQLSLTLEKGGGINTLNILDILAKDGKLYPDRGPTPAIIRREGNLCGKRPVYGPGIQFISTSTQANGRPGRNLFHFPDRTELYPFGIHSESERFGHRLGYDFCIDGTTVLFRFRNAFPERERLVISLNKDHIVSGAMYSMKNHMIDWEVPPPLAHLNIERFKPFEDTKKMTLTWDFIGWDKKLGAFVMDGKMTFAYGSRKVVFMMAGTRPVTVEESKCRYFIALPWDKSGSDDEIRLSFVLAETRGDAAKQAKRLNAEFATVFARKRQAATTYAAQAPQLTIAGIAPAAEFSRTIGAFEQSMVLAETDREACIRAAVHKYGFFAMWDQIYPSRAFLAFGDYTRAEKLLRYMLTLPQVEPHFWITVQLMIQVEEAVALSGNRAFLAEAFPTLKRFFAIAADYADRSNGFLRLNNSSGVDDPKEIGIEGMVWPSCINGWWFNACRAMENMALLLGDAATAKAANALGAKVGKHYIPSFLDPERGYLHAVVNPKNGKGTGVFQNVSTLGMDYPYGDYLFRHDVRTIAEYQAYALCHPAGRSAVAYDDLAHEMWKHVIMFQHIGHETKIARAAGMGDEAFRIAQNNLAIFDRNKTAMETQNLCGADGDISQRANWQAFGASSAWNALVGGVIGIQADLGGFAYVPCDLSEAMSIDGYRFRQTRWDITLSGAGPFVSRFEIDGLPLHGSVRIPADLLATAGSHRLRIVRSRTPFPRPMLLNAAAAAITGLESTPTTLRFTVAEAVHTPLKLYAAIKPTVTIGGKTVAAEWNPATGILWCDAQLTPGMVVQVRVGGRK